MASGQPRGFRETHQPPGRDKGSPIYDHIRSIAQRDASPDHPQPYECYSQQAADHAYEDSMRRHLTCSLNGGVYLRHRLKDNFLPFLPPNYNIEARGVQLWRSGVLACKKLSLFLTRTSFANLVL